MAGGSGSQKPWFSLHPGMAAKTCTIDGRIKNKTMQKITPFLWFDGKAEEAMNFYVSIFKKGKILSVNRNEDGTVFIATFELQGQEFMALNGGPHFKFSEAISFFVDCETQQEVDDLWDKLSEGGEKAQESSQTAKRALWLVRSSG